MDLSYDELRQVARAIGLRTTRKTKKTLADEIERAKASRLRFDPAFAQGYRVADLAVFAKDAGIPRRANGKAKTKQQLIAELTAKRPTGTRKDSLCATLCGGGASGEDARLAQELENTKAQLAMVEAELKRVYEQYQKVSMSNKRMNRRMDVLSMKSTNLVDEP